MSVLTKSVVFDWQGRLIIGGLRELFRTSVCVSILFLLVSMAPRLNALDANSPRFKVVELSDARGEMINATGLNNTGDVAGWIFISGVHRACIWSHTGMFYVLKNPQFSYSDALSINDSGNIVGSAISFSTGKQEAFLGDHKKIYAIKLNINKAINEAYGINNAGQVVGYSYSNPENEGDAQAWIWNGSTRHKLGTLGGHYSKALGINDYGYAVGVSENSSLRRLAVLWKGEHISSLGTLPGSISSEARSINKNNFVTGCTYSFSSYFHAFLWHHGLIKDLGTLNGTYSTANAINDKNQIVGEADTPDDRKSPHAVLWQKNVIYDLNKCVPYDSSWIFQSAIGINNKGVIVGNGFHNGKPAIFYLCP